MEQGKIYVGTSGYSYSSWKGKFYPPGLKSADYLPFFARHYNAVEINSTFYRLPLRKTVKRWAEETPSSFHVCLKVWRFISHQTRLHDNEKYIAAFMDSIQDMAGKKGPLLLQLPPNMKPDFERLDQSLTRFSHHSFGHRWQLAVEIRNKDWYGAELNQVLDQHHAALVMHDMPGAATMEANAGSHFVYMRFHGPRGDYGGVYGKAGLEKPAEALRRYRADGKAVYAFFNNDRDGGAIPDAETLRGLIEA